MLQHQASPKASWATEDGGASMAWLGVPQLLALFQTPGHQIRHR